MSFKIILRFLRFAYENPYLAYKAPGTMFELCAMENQHKRIALVTGANQGVGLHVAKELVASGVTVLLRSRDPERGGKAAKEVGAGAIPIQIDVTD